jgi:tRNA nucleotidyltransferase/poly(A) polymerase
VPEPLVVPRERHPVSRRDIDSEALRVLHRLQQNDYVAYLVGGSVRDLMLGRRPKDFDIGTDAHPGQIKKLFRNCWIIGRRFRLAHIKFGNKTIEVATFRRNVPEGETNASPPGEPDVMVVAQAAPAGDPGPSTLIAASFPEGWRPADHHVSGDPVQSDDTHTDARGIIHRDNTFGTPEEDAFRRDFTINALFYDVATKSVIDYVGGIEDLEKRIIRSIGDPHVRFAEDPVRMFRAAIFGARLSFDLDPLVVEAIAAQRHLITKASSARMLEEYFKVLRSGYAEASFRALARLRLLELITPELKSPPAALWDALAALDRYRLRFPSAPLELTNPVLIGTLLVPIGALNRRMPDRGAAREGDMDKISFGALPVARKDLDRLRHMLHTLPKLTDPALPPRVARGLPGRPSFPDTLTWFEIFGGDATVLEQWQGLKVSRPASASHGQRRGGHRSGHAVAHGAAHGGHGHGAPAGHGAQGHANDADADGPQRRRRRRRRRKPRPAPDG